MDANTLFIILAIVMVACCIGPMLFMKRGHGDSHKERKTGHDSKSSM